MCVCICMCVRACVCACMCVRAWVWGGCGSICSGKSTPVHLKGNKAENFPQRPWFPEGNSTRVVQFLLDPTVLREHSAWFVTLSVQLPGGELVAVGRSAELGALPQASRPPAQWRPLPPTRPPRRTPEASLLGLWSLLQCLSFRSFGLLSGAFSESRLLLPRQQSSVLAHGSAAPPLMYS